MKKVETKCKICDTKTNEPCELANYTTEIDGKTYTFCCKPRATQYKKEKAKEKQVALLAVTSHFLQAGKKPL